MKQEEPKQETLEEFIEKELEGYDEVDVRTYKTFIYLGAKWQQQQNKNLYSEKEVLEQLNLLYSMKNSLVDTFTDKNDRITKKWFNQFKKQ